LEHGHVRLVDLVALLGPDERGEVGVAVVGPARDGRERDAGERDDELFHCATSVTVTWISCVSAAPFTVSVAVPAFAAEIVIFPPSRVPTVRTSAGTALHSASKTPARSACFCWATALSCF